MKKVLAVLLALNAALLTGVLLKKEAVIVHAAAAGVPSGNGDVDGNGTINLTDAVALLDWLFLGGTAPVPIMSSLPATGQTKCYDSQGVVIDCEDAYHPGQDGTYQAACPLEGRFFFNRRNVTVTDACTGLMWQHGTADVNSDGTIDDADKYDWHDALAYCDDLKLAGHDDWRLPNVRELQSIVDYGRWNPSIDPVFEAVSDWYWSSSTYAYDPDFAWVVGFHVGYVGSGIGKGGPHFVRAVRSGP